MVMQRFWFLTGFSLLAIALLGGRQGAAQQFLTQQYPAQQYTPPPQYQQNQQSQDIRPLLDRLDRLERDMNLLQRQVYRGDSASGAPVPAAGPPATGEAALNLEVRVSQIEDQIRTLTGHLEETSYKMDQLRQRLDKLESDIDFRLGQLEHPGQASPPPGEGAPPDGPPPKAGSGPVQLKPPSDPAAADSNGTLVATPGDSKGVLGYIPAGPAGDTKQSEPTAGDAENGSPQNQYDHALNLLRQQKYDEAEQALRGFVKQYPKDNLAGNAQYWLGESYYARNDFSNASAAFADGYEKYPKSSKAPDDLLKLGMSLAAQKQKDNACKILARLDHDYPQASDAVKKQAASEKKRDGCTH